MVRAWDSLLRTVVGLFWFWVLGMEPRASGILANILSYTLSLGCGFLITRDYSKVKKSPHLSWPVDRCLLKALSNREKLS